MLVSRKIFKTIITIKKQVGINMNIYNQPTVSAPAILNLYDILKNKHIIYLDIKSTLGCNREDLTNIETRVPVSLQTKLWDLTRRHGTCPNIGLIVGTDIGESTTGMLSQLLIHSANLREALTLFSKNISLMNQCEQVEIVNTNWGCRVIYKSSYPNYFDISETERSLSSAITWSSQLAGKKITPIRAGFPHSEVKYIDEYKTIFGSNICFNQEFAFLDIDNKTLNLPISTSNDFIKNALINYVNGFKKNLPESDTTGFKVTKIIESELENGICTSDSVAKSLNMSRQTLHRKLQKENINFRYLLEDVRKKKAIEYLFGKENQLDDIGFLLGFKDPSAFYRAFKSWFNMTPKAYRDSPPPPETYHA
jgi:AraC-like DNA-binding protein